MTLQQKERLRLLWLTCLVFLAEFYSVMLLVRTSGVLVIVVCLVVVVVVVCSSAEAHFKTPCFSLWPGSNRWSMGCTYLFLSLLDICVIYREIRSVVFTLLNYERASIVIDDFVVAGGILLSNKSSPPKVSMREHVFLPSRNIPSIFRTVGPLLLSHHSSYEQQCFCGT